MAWARYSEQYLEEQQLRSSAVYEDNNPHKNSTTSEPQLWICFFAAHKRSDDVERLQLDPCGMTLGD